MLTMTELDFSVLAACSQRTALSPMPRIGLAALIDS